MKADLIEAEFRDFLAALILLADRWRQFFSEMPRLADDSLNAGPVRLGNTLCKALVWLSEVLASYIGRARVCVCIRSADAFFTSTPV